jgi:ribosomal protein S21
MVAVKREHNDNEDKMIRRFIKKVKKAGIIEEVNSRKQYVKPSIAARMKRKEAQAERRREQRRLDKQNKD